MNKQNREGDGSAPKSIPPIHTDMHTSVPMKDFGKKK